MKKALTIILFVMFLFPLMAFGDECIEGDCQNGPGVMIFSTGHKFSGEFKGGKKTGRGKLIYPDGREQVGEFKNGEYVGN